RAGPLGRPAEDLRRAPCVDDAPALLPLLGRPVAYFGAAAGGVEQEARERVDVGLDAGPDVHRPGARALEREHVRARDVAHVHVVARLLAVAVDGHRLAPGHPAAEHPHPPPPPLSLPPPTAPPPQPP